MGAKKRPLFGNIGILEENAAFSRKSRNFAELSGILVKNTFCLPVRKGQLLLCFLRGPGVPLWRKVIFLLKFPENTGNSLKISFLWKFWFSSRNRDSSPSGGLKTLWETYGLTATFAEGPQKRHFHQKSYFSPEISISSYFHLKMCLECFLPPLRLSDLDLC